MNKPNFVVFASTYDERSGGAIALHKLCDVLNEMGEHAYVWPRGRKLYRLNWFKKEKPFRLSSTYRTPIATREELKNSVVIYPEVIRGNPLRAKRVVRWFLHKPGYHSGEIHYGKRELYFFYEKCFDDPRINPHPANRLNVFATNPAYTQWNHGPRSGSCYLLRKGKGRTIVHDLEHSVLIDDLSHAEMAKVFNEKEYFYSYDEFTMYSAYAALCGCISIVIPATYSTREEWAGKHQLFQYGIAYGIQDIAHAKATMNDLRTYFQQQERESSDSVKAFIMKVYAHFGLTDD